MELKYSMIDSMGYKQPQTFLFLPYLTEVGFGTVYSLVIWGKPVVMTIKFG